MTTTNFTRNAITRQIANQSNQLNVTNTGGSYQYRDSVTSQVLPGSPSSQYLVTPQNPNDPQIKSQVLAIAKGHAGQANVPTQLVDAISSVAAYTSAVTGIDVNSLFNSDSTPTLKLVSAYNTFKPRGTQLGMFGSATLPWTNNPTLRGSIAAAYNGQP
jgi:hypothetical protein